MASSPVMRDRRGFADGVWSGDIQPKVAGPTAWAGPALLGTFLADDPIVDWPAGDWDIRWTCTIHPHWSNRAGATGEIMYADAGGTDENMEVYFLFEDTGDIHFGMEWDAAAGVGLKAWLPLDQPVGLWDEGIPRSDWRATAVAVGANTVFTLYRDGDVVATDTYLTSTLEAFPTPAPDAPLAVGTRPGYLIALHSLDILDDVDGDPLYSFDAANPTGWSAETGGATHGAIYTPPRHPSFVVFDASDPGGSGTYLVPDPAVFDIAADTSASWVWRFTPPIGDDILYGRHPGIPAMWMLADLPNGGIPHRFVVHDGVAPLLTDVGAFVDDTEVTIGVTLDRADDTLTTYRNGIAVESVDATGFDAIAPNEPVAVGLALGFTAFAGFARRALTATEHLTLHYELAAA